MANSAEQYLQTWGTETMFSNLGHKTFDRHSWVAGSLFVTLLFAVASGCSTKNVFPFLSTPGIEEAIPLGWSHSYADSAGQSRATGKMTMLWFTGSDWCHYCTKLQKEVFETPEFQDWAAANIVPVELDFPKRTQLARELKEQNDALLKKYESYVRGYPTALFLDQQGNVVGKLGYNEGGPAPWIERAQAIVAKASTGSNLK